MNQFKASAVTSLSSPVPWPVPVVGEKVFLTADVRILGANRAPAGGRSRDQAAQHRGHAVRLAAGQVLRPGEKFRRRRRAAEEGSQRQRGDRALLVRRNHRPRGWAGSKVGCPPRGRQHRPGQRYPGPGGSNPADARGFHSELPEHAAKQPIESVPRDLRWTLPTAPIERPDGRSPGFLASRSIREHLARIYAPST